ncbi:hypothetical protein MRX96_046611, partial [Rhipicephalus microplus]
MDARQRLRRYTTPVGLVCILSWDQPIPEDLPSRLLDDRGLSGGHGLPHPRTTSTGWAGRYIVLVCTERSWNKHVLRDYSR